MESNWAEESLRTIRTLMERSALYRRALAPIMIVAGSLGIIGATLPCFIPVEGNRGFALLWLAVSLVSLAAATFFARREALREAEPFWSPPTRRVTQALLPAFSAGLVAGLLFAVAGPRLPDAPWLIASLWTVAYGLALHSAGFFMERGIKALGWIFVLGGATLLCLCPFSAPLQSTATAHTIMGAFFGLLHLTYGIYLYFTEKHRQPS